MKDAEYTCPLLSVRGSQNILKYGITCLLFRRMLMRILFVAVAAVAADSLHETWSGMNRTEPTVTNIVFTGYVGVSKSENKSTNMYKNLLLLPNSRTAVVQHVQNVSPFVLPACCTFRLPVVTTLYFKEQKDSGISKIYKQIDSWTLDGKTLTTKPSSLLTVKLIFLLFYKDYWKRCQLSPFGTPECSASSLVN